MKSLLINRREHQEFKTNLKLHHYQTKIPHKFHNFNQHIQKIINKKLMNNHKSNLYN